MAPINELADLQRDLAALLLVDPGLSEAVEVAGELPLRRRAADFPSLCNIVVSQLLSVAAARTIWGRVEALIVPFTPERLLGFADEELRAAGLSGAKVRTLQAIAREVQAGLDLVHLCEQSGEDAHKHLCKIKGIGPWTADVFLLFCAGHPDVFPSGDVALQNAVQMLQGLDKKPVGKELDAIALRWAPYRGTAARLFWAYYGAIKQGKDLLPV
ncbi:DNA-3-methyladenine glycosylase family protein [Polycladidibacter hongkongensis]|uniref:DNA-3-methyladenine glycosylase family protein n=1 Tax=Polycladidibacter hongkongensis TaxID=1647556 RepID=UPI000831DF73|nr:DNA-3-methyladenine glycosylase [Pseudovibrio hongkongensis]